MLECWYPSPQQNAFCRRHNKKVDGIPAYNTCIDCTWTTFFFLGRTDPRMWLKIWQISQTAVLITTPLTLIGCMIRVDRKNFLRHRSSDQSFSVTNSSVHVWRELFNFFGQLDRILPLCPPVSLSLVSSPPYHPSHRAHTPTHSATTRQELSAPTISTANDFCGRPTAKEVKIAGGGAIVTFEEKMSCGFN